MKPGDQEAISNVVELVLEVSKSDPFIGFPVDSGADAAAALATFLAGGLDSGRTHLFVVNHEVDHTVGCVLLTQQFSIHYRHIANLAIGAVQPAHRGRGLVTSAFDEIVRRCPEIGVELLRLEVYEGVPAEKVWRNYGFEEYGRLADYARVDGESYAAIFLAQSVARLRANVLDHRPESGSHALSG